MPLKAEPQLVIEEFERLFGKGEDKSGVHIRHDADQLRAFLATWFSNAGDDTEAVSSSCEYLTRDRSWGNELLASMQKLLRRARISSDASIRSTLIAAPNPFIIPGERFRESYYWDSHWIILGLLKRRNPQDLKVAMVRSLHALFCNLTSCGHYGKTFSFRVSSKILLTWLKLLVWSQMDSGPTISIDLSLPC